MGTSSCACTLKCFEKVPEEQRKRLFTGFWDSGNFDVQISYLCGCVRVMKKKRSYSKLPTSRRQYTRMYYIMNRAISEQVYKKAFLSIHGISNGQLERAIQVKAWSGHTTEPCLCNMVGTYRSLKHGLCHCCRGWSLLNAKPRPSQRLACLVSRLK